MPRWFDKAEQEIETSLENGEIDNAEYHSQMRDLQDELQCNAEEAGNQARDDYYN